MRAAPLAVDVALAVVAAAIVLIVSPGLAVTAIIATFVLLVCGISYAFGARRAGSSRPRRPRAPRR